MTVKGTEQADDVNVDAAAGGVVVDGLADPAADHRQRPTDHLQIDTLAGDDSVDVDDGVADLIDVGVDLGTDEV